tara:strand:+ start:130 stop:915 length:786 start_codon:yes stop_codon:yes gene_type:complete
LNSTKLIDSHVNFGHELLVNSIDKIVKESLDNDIHRMLCINSNLYDFNKDLTLVNNYSCIDISLGHHPNLVDIIDLIEIEHLLELHLNQSKKIIAIGETGLDFYYEANRTKQIDSLKIHFEVASKFKLPVIIHMRDSEEQITPLIKQYRDKVPNILIHCFTGTGEFAKKCIDLDCYFSISGIFTFKKADNLRKTLKILPKNRIIFETDSPYLTPDPHRGKVNYPKYLKIILSKYCDLVSMETKEMSDISNSNYFNLFSINN